MDAHPLALLEGDRARAQDAALGVEHEGGPELFRGGEHVPAGDLLDGDLGEVDGHAHARDRAGGLPALGLDAPHPDLAALGEELQLVLHGHRAREGRPGDHRAEALHREDPVHRQPEERTGGLVRLGGGHGDEGGAHVLDPPAAERVHAHDGAAVQEGAPGHLADVVLYEIYPVALGQAGLGNGDHSAPDPKEIHDVEVLPGLGHDAVVRGDDQQGEVHRGRPRHHVLDEPLVAGHVDEGDVLVDERVAQLDGDPPLPLLLEPIGLGAGEGAH